MAAYRRGYDLGYVTCRLTAKNRDQLRNPTVGNRVWATFYFNYCPDSCSVCSSSGGGGCEDLLRSE